MKRFLVVIPREDRGFEVYPMKEWLRSHPELVPSGLDATNSTSHQLRNGLRKTGWSVQDAATEVRLTPPNVTVTGAALDAVLGDDDVTEQEEDAGEAAFELEYQLRDFIAHNLHAVALEGHRLSLYRDAAGRSGVEFSTDVGFIDILTTDQDGNFVIFELKRGRSPDHTVGQLARYMGWVKHKIANGRRVSGVIVAREISDTLRYAASVIPDVGLFEYKVAFKLHNASLTSADAPVS